jgi:hypothetical protein
VTRALSSASANFSSVVHAPLLLLHSIEHATDCVMGLRWVWWTSPTTRSSRL